MRARTGTAQAAPTIAWVEFPGSPSRVKNKLDALFNDSSHTYTVEPIRWTMKAATGINIGVNQQPQPSFCRVAGTTTSSPWRSARHYHTVSELDVGSGPAIDITPLNYTVYAYIRA